MSRILCNTEFRYPVQKRFIRFQIPLPPEIIWMCEGNVHRVKINTDTQE